MSDTGLQARVRAMPAPEPDRRTAIGARVGRDAITRAALGTADAVAATLAAGLVIWRGNGEPLRPAILGFAVLVLVIHKAAGLYDRDDLVLRRSTLDELPALAQLSGVFSLIVAAGAGALFSASVGAGDLIALWVLTALLLTGGRYLARALAGALAPAERCLVVGDAERVAQVCQKLAAVHAHADVVATITVRRGMPLALAGPTGLSSLIAGKRVHRVVIAPTSHDTGDTVDLVRIAKAAGVRVSILPRVLEAVGSAVEFEQLDGMTMLGVRRFGLTRSSQWVKRTFDVVVGSVVLVAVAPLLGVLALAVKLDSAGPVFFRQTRVGRDGEPFQILKLRSMVADAEARKRALRQAGAAGGGLFKLSEDPRVTRVGRVLRRTSLDELPQLLNVLRGQMSLVGPRPLVTDEDALVEGIYRLRLHLTPGMTGPWQVLGSSRLPLEEMVGIDYLYVANWSLWEDVKILVRTVPFVVLRRGL